MTLKSMVQVVGIIKNIDANLAEKPFRLTAHSQSKRNKVTHWLNQDKIIILAILESLLHAGKTSNSERTRFYIEKRRGEGINQATIARELALPRSTISRELRRNTNPTFNGVYCCRRADTMARGRRHKPLSENAFHQLEPHIQDFIRQELSTHSSPEIISGSLHLEFGISISKNTLYRYILQERQAGVELYQQLPHRGKRYRYNAENIKSGPIPTVLALIIAQLKPLSNRNLATSRLTLFLAKTRSHSC